MLFLFVFVPVFIVNNINIKKDTINNSTDKIKSIHVVNINLERILPP